MLRARCLGPCRSLERFLVLAAPRSTSPRCAVGISNSRAVSTSLTRRRIPPAIFPLHGFKIIDASTKIEEETLPFYAEDIYYPARLGELICDQYQIVAKLGYGASSTTWLAHDLFKQQYLVLKIHVNQISHPQELHVLEHLKSVKSDHPGSRQIRALIDHFIIKGPHGCHVVFVLPPLGVSVRLLQDLQPGGVYGEETAISAIQQTLMALDFLHCEANVVHTDVHSGNLLLGITDESMLAQYEQKELKDPSPRKVFTDRAVYTSQMLLDAGGLPQLCDFGHARICADDEPQQGIAMPVQYRAPEILLDMQWDHTVDMWSVGLLAWDLLHTESLFNVYDDDPETNTAHHLAHMVSLIGPPPLQFLRKSNKSRKYWDEDGNWRGVLPLPPPVRLESLVTTLEGKSKEDSLSFIRAMLRWEPSERLSTGYAYAHRWLFREHL
ncbi:protein kinase domain-containing protein [Sarocladium implicatum]|nr:protein kinase domain-containing protein [Sarocladium implicatum]